MNTPFWKMKNVDESKVICRSSRWVDKSLVKIPQTRSMDFREIIDMIFSKKSKGLEIRNVHRLESWSNKLFIVLSPVVFYPHSRITTAKYFCIKIRDLTIYFLRVEYRTNGLSRAATDFVYKNSNDTDAPVSPKSR